MSQRFPVCNAKEVVKVLRRHGFGLVGQSGSHQKWRHANGRQVIVALHGSVVPKTLEALYQLHGVGRKTANVVLGNAFGIPGMVVDTHVGRIGRRLGLTKHSDPVKVEHELMRLFPRERWTQLGHELIQFGRKFCKAPTPRCSGCPLIELCPFKGKVMR